MKRSFLLVFAVMLGLLVGLLLSCGGSSSSGGGHSAVDDDVSPDDDDDASPDDDDDASPDDDNDASPDDDDDDDDDSGTELFSIQFNGYALGNLPAPWDVSGDGATTFTVIADPTKTADRVLEVSGDVAGDGIAAYPFANTVDTVSVAFDIYNTPASSFGFSVCKTASANDWIMEIWRNPNTGEVIVAPGFTACAPSITDNAWLHMEVDLHLADKTFDLLIDGAATACAATPLSVSTSSTLGSFNLRDWGNAGYGGIVYYNNIVGREYPASR